MAEPRACRILDVAYCPPFLGAHGLVGCLFRRGDEEYACRSLVVDGTMLTVDLSAPVLVIEAMRMAYCQPACQRGPALPPWGESTRN